MECYSFNVICKPCHFETVVPLVKETFPRCAKVRVKLYGKNARNVCSMFAGGAAHNVQRQKTAGQSRVTKTSTGNGTTT